MNVDQKLPSGSALLTEKQIEVLELLVDHRSTKEIARMLGISPSAVDQRIHGAGGRLGEGDRRELARKYAALRTACAKPTGGLSQVPPSSEWGKTLHRDADLLGVFQFNDAATFREPAPWMEDAAVPLLEKLDARTGPLGRIAVIVAIATLLAFLLLAAFTIARTLDVLM